MVAVTPLAAQAAALLPSGSGAGPAGSSAVIVPAAADVRTDTELVLNGGFEDGLTGWRVGDPATQNLTAMAGGHAGRASAVLTGTRGTTAVLNDTTNTVPSTSTGLTYRVSAYVRGSRPGLAALLRVREVRAGRLVDSGGTTVITSTAWQPVSFTYRTASDGAHLDLNLVGWKLPAGAGIGVDDVSVHRVGPVPAPVPTTTSAPTGAPVPPPTGVPTPDPTLTPAPTTDDATSTSGVPPTGPTTPVPPVPLPPTVPPAPTVPPVPTVTLPPIPTPAPPRPTTPTTPPTTPPTTSVPAPPTVPGTGGCLSPRGIPSCGPLLGAAIGGNADPAASEAQFGGRLALHRTYFQANQQAAAVRTAAADLAAGRLPWISFKLPSGWAPMASGSGDGWARDIAAQLGTLHGPVWLAFHHEPENDGTMADWVRLQARLGAIVRATAPNVAYSIILTGWNQVFGGNPALSFQALWPGDDAVDILAIDPYNEYGVVKNGKMITQSVELKQYYAPLAAFAAAHHVHWAVAETGYTDLQAARDPAWLNRAFTDMRAMGGVGLAYFDSSLNSIGDWPLDTQEKVGAFGSALRLSARLTP